MLLYHATPITNRASIQAGGLLTIFAKGKRKRVWACQRWRIPWAVKHTAKRHAEAEHGIDVWVCWCPDSKTRKSGKRGLFYCEADIIPEEVGLLITYADPPWAGEDDGEGA